MTSAQAARRTSRIGKSNYNALQALLQKGMSSGSSASIAYTYSKTLGQNSFANALDSNLEKVVAAWDVRHSIQINGVFELPFGPGHFWGATAPSVVRTMVGGWRVSALARIQSGLPMASPSGVIPTGISARLANPTLQRWFLLHSMPLHVPAFDARDFTSAAIGVAKQANAHIFVDRLGEADAAESWQKAVEAGANGIQTNRPAELAVFLHRR